MKSIVIPNALFNKKVKLADGNVLKMISIFYKHPYLLKEESWGRLEFNNESFLVDPDTLHILSQHVTELIYLEGTDKIQSVRITTELKGEELNKHWDEILEYCAKVRYDINKFNHMIKKVKSPDESDDEDPHSTDQLHENVQQDSVQIPLEKLSLDSNSDQEEPEVLAK